MTFQYCFDGSIKKVNNLSVSSPRTWGCFHSSSPLNTMYKVFPTHVGVFPSIRRTSLFLKSLPHARGGVSIDRNVPLSCGPVFPTHVGVFPVLRLLLLEEHCLPHARGGVSSPPTLSRESFSSSPRTWGCFCPDTEKRRVPAVFPTHVGVFPSTPPSRGWSRSLPHARGGVSGHQTTCAHPQQSSPRTWGCFRSSRRGRST